MDSPSGPAFCCLQVFLPALNHSVFFFFYQFQTVWGWLLRRLTEAEGNPPGVAALKERKCPEPEQTPSPPQSRRRRSELS